MILVNGCPKMGNHALQKAVALLGADPGPILHIRPMDQIPPEITHHLFVYRDPRNALISWMRSHWKPITSGMILSEIKGGEYLGYLGVYSSWMQTYAYKVKFEDLIADDRCIRAIADYLGVPYREDAFPNLPGYTRTWSGNLSDFRSHWTEEIDSVWRDAGGDVLLKAYGYAPWSC